MRELVLHPNENRKPNHSVSAIAQRWVQSDGTVKLELRFKILPIENVEIPHGGKAGERQDGLWRQTCCECFIGFHDTAEYQEWNFSHSGQWAAYEFQRYRAGLRNLETRSPRIVHEGDELKAEVIDTRGLLIHKSIAIALTAVVVEKGSVEPFYWALVHCGEKPDFHVRSSFILELQ